MWFIIGIIIGIVVTGLLWLLKRNNSKITWYEWLVGLIGLAFLLFALQNFFGSLAELMPDSANMFLLLIGLPGLVLLAVVWQLAIRRAKKD
ncbi:reductive dehalogenase membrane-bound subunit [Dehalococcoides mccartyi]|uniref:dehalogenase n=1 Tax=Dehalococcoides mccartyi TaxID=61435 RepID=UPI0015E67B09|nr:dehalogenase [Dehalococcoides mccartyi]MBA2084244.1 reductive dehalogenase membrane-bound subunit [Dehalococcoides mccartyi]